MQKLYKNNHLILVICTTLFIAIFFTSTDFVFSPVNGVKDALQVFLQFSLITLFVFLLTYSIAVFKYVFAFVLPILVFCISILAYFRVTINATLTPLVIDAALGNSDQRIVYELISVWLILFVLVSVSIAGLLVKWRFNIQVKFNIVPGLVSLGLFLFLINIPFLLRPASMRIPFNIYYSTREYFHAKTIIESTRPSLQKGLNHDSVDPELTVVFVIGESLRADHLSVNGYHRNTTPKLQELGIISLPFLHSTYPYTSASVPHILTRADKHTKELAQTDRSFIDLFKASGFQTTWIGNQELSNSYTYFAHEADSLILTNRQKSVYTHSKWLDIDLLLPFQERVKTNSPRKLIILHTIGSHWWYDSHYPENYKIYKPTATSRIVSANTAQEMINSYDNSIHYMDEVLSRVIEKLKNKNALFIYLSDHAESLGEDGLWLHASEAEVLYKSAFFIWFSDQYKQNHPNKVKALMQNKNKIMLDDVLFHSIIDGAGITSPYVKKGLSVFQ